MQHSSSSITDALILLLDDKCVDPHADPGKDIETCVSSGFHASPKPLCNSMCHGRNFKTSVEKNGGEKQKKASYKRCTGPACLCIHFLHPSQRAKDIRVTGGQFQPREGT